MREVRAAGHSTRVRVSKDSLASAASAGSAPQTLTLGLERPAAAESLTAEATPLRRPPPETGASTREASGSCWVISRPQVACPAMMWG